MHEKTYIVHVTSPVGLQKPTGLVVYVRSSYGRAFSAAQRAHMDRLLDLRYQGERSDAWEEVDRTAACVVSWQWTNGARFMGDMPECTRANVVRLLEAVPWIRAQISQAVVRADALYRELETQLCDELAHRMRYDTPNETGYTRRERNARFGMAHLTPNVSLNPDNAIYHDIFWQLSPFRQIGFNGPERLRPETIRAWCEFSGTDLSQEELRLVIAMDQTFVRMWHDENSPPTQKSSDQRHKNYQSLSS